MDTPLYDELLIEIPLSEVEEFPIPTFDVSEEFILADHVYMEVPNEGTG